MVLDELSQVLVYKSIDSVIGKVVSITSLAKLNVTLKEFLRTDIPYIGDLHVDPSLSQFVDGLPWHYGPFAKYRILDLTFDLIDDVEVPLAGRATLSQLGLVDEDWLSNYIEEVRQHRDRKMLRLFLTYLEVMEHSRVRHNCMLISETEVSQMAEEADKLAKEIGVRPEELRWSDEIACLEKIALPQKMKIEDACITNFRYIWSEKHFYM